MLESSCPYPPKSANTTVFAKKKRYQELLFRNKMPSEISATKTSANKQNSLTRKKTANNFSWHWMSSLHPVPYAFPPDPGWSSPDLFPEPGDFAFPSELQVPGKPLPSWCSLVVCLNHPEAEKMCDNSSNWDHFETTFLGVKMKKWVSKKNST